MTMGPAQSVPDDPGWGVLVVGMHRSGTSVATEVLNRLGLSTCTDPVEADQWNPRGYWESMSLLSQNEHLLRRLGSTWSRPPTDVDLAALGDELPGSAARFATVHPASGWVWKDPRNCILLPFWRRALSQRLAVVLMLRHPIEIAASLARRNQLSTEWSLALWERYVRAALVGAQALPVLVCWYERLLEDPVRWTGDVVTFLTPHGFRAPAGHSKLIEGCVDPSLREADAGESDDAPLNTDHRRLLETLYELSGPHAHFIPPPSNTESRSTRLFLFALSARRRSSTSAHE